MQSIDPYHVAGKATASAMEQFWDVMQQPTDVQRLAPASRWDIDSVYTPNIVADKMSVTVR